MSDPNDALTVLADMETRLGDPLPVPSYSEALNQALLGTGDAAVNRLALLIARIMAHQEDDRFKSDPAWRARCDGLIEAAACWLRMPVVDIRLNIEPLYDSAQLRKANGGQLPPAQAHLGERAQAGFVRLVEQLPSRIRP